MLNEVCNDLSIKEALEKDNIPNKKSAIDNYFFEEERRLLYVGMTRATEQLHLVTNRQKGQPSQFLEEIKTYILESLPVHRAQKLKKRKLKNAQMRDHMIF